MSENDDFRANLGCVNGVGAEHRGGRSISTTRTAPSSRPGTWSCRRYSNWQFNGIFQDYAPVTAGYVEVRTNTPDAAFTCYGSVLDNLTSDPTTVLPQ